MSALKIIFLDIDGVLNSDRSKSAFGSRPWPDVPDSWHFFDEVAVRLVARVAKETGAQVVLSSSWRTDFPTKEDLRKLGNRLGLTIIDATPTQIKGPWGELIGSSNRGDQIASWLANHPEVEDWAIVDDVDEMTPDQGKRLVLVDGEVGFSVANMFLLKRILTRRELPLPKGEFEQVDAAQRIFLLERENKRLKLAAREFAHALDEHAGITRDPQHFPELEDAFQAIAPGADGVC